MRFSILFATVACVLAAEAVADDARSCAQMSNPDDRLNCYDNLHRTTERPTTESAWRSDVTTSQLDDSQRVVLSVSSEERLSGRFGRAENARLIIRCEQNTTSLFVTWGGHFMSSIQGGGRVDYRIDSRSPGRINMVESNDNQALGLWRGNAAIPFIRQLIDADTLYVRATPFSESRVEATFVISGLEAAIGPVREACNW